MSHTCAVCCASGACVLAVGVRGAVDDRSATCFGLLWADDCVQVLDDFIRNFFIKMKLNKTLETFRVSAAARSNRFLTDYQAEWYELTQKGILTEEDVGVVPDIYLRNQQMDDNVK